MEESAELGVLVLASVASDEVAVLILSLPELAEVGYAYELAFP